MTAGNASAFFRGLDIYLDPGCAGTVVSISGDLALGKQNGDRLLRSTAVFFFKNHFVKNINIEFQICKLKFAPLTS